MQELKKELEKLGFLFEEYNKDKVNCKEKTLDVWINRKLEVILVMSIYFRYIDVSMELETDKDELLELKKDYDLINNLRMLGFEYNGNTKDDENKNIFLNKNEIGLLSHELDIFCLSN
jgi:hypothetical protein